MPTLTRAKPTLEVSVDFAANPTAQYSDIHETDDGVVSFWRMNSTSTFLDELGVNNGTLISTPATIAGPYPYDSDLGTTFDGANDSAYVLDSTSLSVTGSFSVDGWIRVSALPGSTVDLVGKAGSWKFQLDSSGKVIWYLKNDTSTATVTSNTAIATNTWYHVTGVYDGTSALLYLNGVLDNSAAYSSGIEDSMQPIRFAGKNAVTAPTFQSSQTGSGTSTSVTCNAPVSIAAGDLLLAQFGVDETAEVTAAPTDWFPLIVSRDTNNKTYIYYKIGTGSEPASYTWTLDASNIYAIGISRITGQDTIAPFANAYANGSLSGTSYPTGTHLPSVDNNMVLAFFCNNNAGGGAIWTEDSGTERYDAGVANRHVGMCSQTQATATSINVTGTGSSGNSGDAIMVVLAGTGVTETACSLDDFTFWNRALDSDDVARNYISKDSGTAVWTAVTTEVRHLSASGAERRHELDTLVNGKLDMVLREVGDKDFDPGNTSSPYGPDVEQRVRVRATWNAVTYDVFLGYAEQWTPVRLGADKEEVQFSAVDGFDLLALAGVEGTVQAGYSGEQINTLLNKALWPLSARDIDTGQYVMNGYTLDAGSNFALAVIQEVAASERGIVFIDGAGVFHFHDAAHRGSQTRSTTSQATFSDYPGGTGNLVVSSEIRYQGIQPTRDKDKIINAWTVSPDSGVFGAADQTMVDHVSRARYGARSATRSTRLALNADALDQAGNLILSTAYPIDRYESMTVIPLTTESYATCLDLRISDRVTVKRGFTPGWPGASMTRDYFVEGKTVQVEPDSAWQFTFVLSPVSSGNYYQTIMQDGPVSYWRMDTIT